MTELCNKFLIETMVTVDLSESSESDDGKKYYTTSMVSVSCAVCYFQIQKWMPAWTSELQPLTSQMCLNFSLFLGISQMSQNQYCCGHFLNRKWKQFATLQSAAPYTIFNNTVTKHSSIAIPEMISVAANLPYLYVKSAIVTLPPITTTHHWPKNACKLHTHQAAATIKIDLN